MGTLSNVVRKYLTENGISDKFFEKYIDAHSLLAVNGFRIKQN